FASIHSAVHYIVEEERPSELPMVWIMLDEAHEFLPKDGKTASSDALIMLLREGRQPGIAMLLATQQPGKIHTDAMTQSDIILSHRLTAKIDTDALASLLQSYLRTGLDNELANLPKVPGACIAVDDVNERMFPMRVRPRFSWHGGSAPSIVKEERKFEL
ncbi:ATP-binding protein, partial [Candidatus Woesearchaeota archaeon]|nr:ATP-binding protein [Candidatus Woesearchaeota archaeon]